MQDKYERIVDHKIQRERERNDIRIRNAFVHRINDRERDEKLRKDQAKAEHEYNIYRSAEIEFDHDPIAEVPDEVKLPTYYFDEVAHRTEYNKVYAEHYAQRYIDTNKERYKNMSERMLGCHKSWFGDHYKKIGYFNVKRVFHCHNRWCWLCSHLKQAQRLYKYHIKFEQLTKHYDLYHVVFTVKNVAGEELEATIKKMHNAFKRLVRYFQGFGKINGIDLMQYGFVGAIRSFEIVVNSTDYHPHIHALFFMAKDLDLPKTEINKFSFKNGILVHKFSKLEILIQKIFFLLVNGKRVNPKNIGQTPLGYSCIMDLVEDEAWHEVFKYATKMSKDGASTCTYEQFCLLDDILFHTKMIQGYGIFYNDKDEEDNDSTAEILFEKVLIMLGRIEKPERDVNFELEKLVDEIHKNKLTVISKKMSYKFLQTLVEDLHRELMIQDGDFPF